MSFQTNPAALVPAAPKGRISLVGAGPGAADLLTLRAVRCLSQADIVFYDRLVDPEALAFAKPGAEQVYVGKDVGAHHWPQPRIDAAIVAAAMAGRYVVRLKSGDPSIFGRAAEEIAAARAHGIAVDIVPGITAASAAAAFLCEPLTERGATDRVVLATATCAGTDAPSHIADIARPGTSLVFYMAMQQLKTLTDQLLAAGVAPDQPVTVATHVTKPNARRLRTTLARLAADCQHARLQNPAVILIKLAKAAVQPETKAQLTPLFLLPDLL
jgi:uroporphyrin-III C-methyltransferase